MEVLQRDLSHRHFDNMIPSIQFPFLKYPYYPQKISATTAIIFAIITFLFRLVSISLLCFELLVQPE